MLAKRALTGVTLALAVGASVVAGPRWSPMVVIGLLVLAGAWEWAALIDRRAGRLQRSLYVSVVALAMALAWFGTERTEALAVALWWLAAGWWLVALGLVLHAGTRSADVSEAPPTPEGPSHRLGLGVAGLLSLVPAWLALGMVHKQSSGAWALLTIIGLTVAADIGAYTVGRLVGRHRLAPRVSPGKTLEGLAGGVACTLLVAIVLAWLALPTPSGFLFAAVLIALVSVLGDLTVSLFKRRAGVKHSGRLLPGHGGVLDRIDSFCATAPAWALWLTHLRGPA